MARHLNALFIREHVLYARVYTCQHQVLRLYHHHHIDRSLIVTCPSNRDQAINKAVELVFATRGTLAICVTNAVQVTSRAFQTTRTQCAPVSNLIPSLHLCLL